MQLKKIHKIGIEIEGGWHKGFEDETFHQDISLRREDFRVSQNIGEIVSRPSDNLRTIEDYIYNRWPIEVTDRCAFHIHISLHDTTDYVTCMSRDFYDKFLNAMDEWGRKINCQNRQFWERLEKKNKYCAGEFIPDIQVACKTKDDARKHFLGGLPIRYTHLNYCYQQYGTIENRLFPTFVNPYLAYSGLLAFIDFVEKYLTENRTPDTISSAEIEEEPPTPTVTTIKLQKFNYLKFSYNQRKEKDQYV
jgi:hypothetical protein